MKPTLVLGLGNLLQCDDGVGCRVAQALEQRVLPTDVEVLDAGTPGIGLLNLMQDRQRVIIIDAAEMGLQPGEFKRFGAEDVQLTGSKERISLHRTGIVDTLALAQQLKIELPKLVFFGIQPEKIDWQDGLSPQVQATVPRIVESILKEVSGT
ncbi:MAG: hydrogenase maturation protease [Chloroflexi bacterium]|nr:hydrogenase maturation protease [Chloroflexota bacterium]